jgi:2-keto-3-deoxy-L-rhamnonate aldolase RhmA
VTRVGTVISVAEPALAEMAAGAFDLVWIDLEHGALTVRDAQQLAIAARAGGCEAHVRLPTCDSEALAAVLDAGVDGVVAPRVETGAEAAAFARRLRHAPAGSRGFGPRRAGGYGRVAAFWDSPEARVECTVQIETPAGVEAARAIARTDGVDAVVLGCGDLSLALGVPQQLGAPALVAAAERVAAEAFGADRWFGVAAGGDPAAIAALAGGRADVVLYSADVRLYAAAVDEAARALRTAAEGAHAPA